MKHLNKCVHFTGVQHNVCKAGVNYDTFTKGLPCLKELNAVETCDRFLAPTAEEIAADEAIHKQHMDRMALVFAAVAPIRKEQKGKNWHGVITCPACGGRLHLSHAAYNGHIHGRCETKDCVSWME